MADTRDGELTSHCYCGINTIESNMVRCQKCQHYFHLGCLKTGSPTTLAGDIFYYLTCIDCAEDGAEDCERMELQWLQVVMLSLYNLHLTSAGKHGFFRWKEHICAFIDKHWFTYFGPSKKKTTTWHGTVAGILSSNRPTYFKSGVAELGESGWWRLAENKPPTMDTFRYQKHLAKVDKQEVLQVEGLRRRRSKTTLEAAMELKAKRAHMLEAKEIRRSKKARLSVEKQESKSETAISVTPDRGHFKEVTSRSEVSTPVPITMVRDVSREADSSCMSGDHSEVETESSLDDSHRVSELSGDSSFINSSILSKSSLVESDLLDQDSQMSVASSNSALWLTERDLVVGDQVPQCLMMEDDGEDTSDLDIDICAITPPASPVADSSTAATDGLPRMTELLSSLSSGNASRDHIKQEPPDQEEEESSGYVSNSFNMQNEVDGSDFEDPDAAECCSDEEKPMDSASDSALPKVMLKSSAVSETSGTGNERESQDGNDRLEPSEKESIEKPIEKMFAPLSLYEEKQLLKKLQGLESVMATDPQASRLRRKLLLRQLKRERGMPLFDIECDVKQLMAGNQSTETSQIPHHLNREGLPTVTSHRNDVRVLDRYQRSRLPEAYLSQPVSFLNRLVGTEDDQLQCIRSPYTARMLKPFIRRDYESRPRKMLMLEEIRAYPHRNDPTWTAPPTPPIDYCYVRPEHIPTINTICREFFWPGIDLSECLQYPDFSCVVLYRKFIIAFAFMVPDVKYNEAYISFIFTHPEWRGAGIATFMIYHLIQTCMGKDVTLHVSASNTAMLLYQRFGFKAEQFILDFYDKYYPEESTESRHAFFIRLRR